MDRIYDNCCGIDVHKKLIVACFRKGNKQEIREFGATTRELLEMADWLKDGVVFKDLGADYYNQFNKERKINAYLKKLKALGWEAPVVAA